MHVNRDGPLETEVAGPDRPTTTTNNNPKSHAEATSDFSTSSRQVSWWPVCEFVQPYLDAAAPLPMAGTPAWCALDDDDPRKLAAALDASRHHALRMETAQQAMADASRDVSGSADWSRVAREIQQRNEFYASKPWLRRSA